jgi:hypothetical protein
MADLAFPGAAISGGLQGLVEAYKMRMAEAQEAARLKQSGANAATAAESANLRAMLQAMKEPAADPFAAQKMELAERRMTEMERHNQAMENRSIGGGGAKELTPEETDAWVRALKSGTPLSAIGTRGISRAKVGARYIMDSGADEGAIDPTIGDLEVAQKGKLAGTAALNQAQIRKTLAAFPQYQKALDQYLESVEKLKPRELIPWNKLVQGAAEKVWAPKEYGDALGNAKALQTEMAMQGSRVFADTAMQEQAFKNELDRLSPAMPLSRVKKIVATMRDLAESRKQELLGMPISFPPGTMGTNPARFPSAENAASPQIVNTGEEWETGYEPGGWEPVTYRGKPARRRKGADGRWQVEVAD